MRWFLIDKFVELEKGKRAKAVKNISLSEDHLHDHFPGFPIMPPSLMVESMAQTGGILAGYTKDFEENVILAKIPKVEFFEFVRPGDQLVLEAELVEIRDEGSTVHAWGSVEGKRVLEGEIMFFHVNEKNAEGPDFKFVFTDELLTALNLN